MNQSRNFLLISTAAGACALLSSTWLVSAQQGTFSQPGPPAKTPGPKNPAPRPQLPRPFMFQTPQDEPRFNESVQRLIRTERRLETNQQNLLRRLGEVRQLPAGERQNAALFDLMQQILLQQEELQKLITQTRTAFSGDVDLDPQQVSADDPFGPPIDQQPDNPRR